MKPQTWLAPLSPLYSAAVAAKNFSYDYGLFPKKKLRAPVVSIGNLSTGGGGKTPFAIALAELAKSLDIPLDILSRGYGRGSDAVERVDPAPGSTAEQYGDEPLLIARRTGLPAFVGGERYAAGSLAEQDGLRIHLLDDGFQHRKLMRDFDIVLVHRDDLTQRLLPAGHLREPLTSLRRAHAIVLRDEDRELELELRPYLNSTAAVWHVRRQIDTPSISGKAIAFCGIARPAEFFTALRTQGIELSATIGYPDHHRFTDADVHALIAEARRHNAAGFLTTEKDIARLSSTATASLQQIGPVQPVPLQVTILESLEVTRRIRALYASLRPPEHRV